MINTMNLPIFLKWAGGKRKVIPQIDPHLPKNIETYYEPFLGAGAMFFYIKNKYNPKNCVISDINKDLIDTFVAVRDNPIKLINLVEKLKKKNSKEFYFKIRSIFNSGKVRGLERCAVFIYLNKTCFNGLYRVNRNGEFNVPYGNSRNPEIINGNIILEASGMLKGVKIICQDYYEIINTLKKGDFVYLDPCYDPLKKTSFANYTPKRFNDEDNFRLANFVHRARIIGVRVLFSNNVTENVDKLYSNKEYKKVVIYCNRSINSIGKMRGAIPEYLIRTGY